MALTELLVHRAKGLFNRVTGEVWTPDTPTLDPGEPPEHAVTEASLDAHSSSHRDAGGERPGSRPPHSVPTKRHLVGTRHKEGPVQHTQR